MGKKLCIIGIVCLIMGCSSTERNKNTYDDMYAKNNLSNSSSDKNKGLDRISFFEKYNYPEGKFYIATKNEYLSANNDNSAKKKYFQSDDEKEFLKFYKNLDIRGYGDNSGYWRWNFSLTHKELNSILNKNLPIVAKNRSKDILTLVDNKWQIQEVPLNPIGNLSEIKVMERGKSGIIIKLLIKGSRGTYLIAREHNIRGLISLNKNTVGREVNIYGANGAAKEYSQKPISRNPNLLPSGYFAFEKKASTYNFYGGGYGHGVGMSQWGVADLTKNYGYSYKAVLHRYYKSVKLENMYNLPGVGKTIRVGIMTTSFKSLDHDKVVLSSGSSIKIKNSKISLEAKPREKVEFINKNGQIKIFISGKQKAITKEKIEITSSKAMISVNSIKRNIKKISSPSYRGSFEVRLSKNENKLRLINEVDIEQYLLQVLPSEMPESFGLEALKVQAVAARTYALSDYQKGRYLKDGFHITDSTQSQVYNNLDENPKSRQAISMTKGEVMTYKNKPIDAKYYSTSSGYGAAAHNVW
ncbi:MAG: SpoIID/LytB domain-containing protein [Cetobacterium sp.]|uniref:SpoIID/LytB domain-containing protein n=1 Tax=Cetobacterium sp. TaxID=2071632 RepID=UPI002FC9855F